MAASASLPSATGGPASLNLWRRVVGRIPGVTRAYSLNLQLYQPSAIACRRPHRSSDHEEHASYNLGVANGFDQPHPQLFSTSTS